MTKQELLNIISILESMPWSLKAEEKLQRVLQELRIRQIELQMQQAELKNTRELLEASLDRYSNLYDFAPTAYLTFDPDCCIQGLNLTGAKLLGRPRYQLIGMPFSLFVAKDQIWAFKRHVRECIRAQEAAVHELDLALEGRPSPRVQLHTLPVPDPEGQPLHARSVLLDLSAQRAAEARFALLAEHTDQVVVALGADGRVGTWNRAAERRFGRLRAQALGRPFGDLLPPDLARALEARLRAHRAGEPVDPFAEPGWEWTFLAPEGPEGEVLCLGRPLPEASRAVPVWTRTLAFRMDGTPNPARRHG